MNLRADGLLLELYDVNSPGGGATHWVGLSGKNLQII